MCPSSIPFLLALWLFATCNAMRIRLDGHLTHGVNTFNDKPMIDFSRTSKVFSAFPIYEVGVINPGGTNASAITEDTPLDALMATIDAWDIQQALDFPRSVGPFNVPIMQAPTIFQDSQDINDRIPAASFAASKDFRVRDGPYLSADSNGKVTLRQWNKMAARISGFCRGGKAKVTVRIKNGLPNGVYTMWDVGVINALKKSEEFVFGPFGGLPNIVTTDKSGSGKISRDLNYCPLEKCPGSKRCTLYVSLFYHFDNMVYGALPTLDSVGQGIGLVGSNQIQFFFNGEVIVPPQNKF